MRVKCGNCGTAYDIDEKLFGGDKVVRVRCSKCRSVFSPKKPSMPNVNAETRLPFFQTTSNSTVHTVGRQKVEKSMLVKCSNCGTAYNFDERLFSGQKLRVRCSRCRHVFSVLSPALASEAVDVKEVQPLTPASSVSDDSVTVYPRIEKKIKPALSRVFIWSALSLFTGCFVVFGLWFMLSPGEEGTFVARVSSGFKLMYNEITKEKAAMVQEEQIVVEILPSEELRKISVVMGDPLVFVDALYRNVVVQKGKVINRTGYKLQAVRVEGMLYDEEAEIIKKNFSIAGNEVDIATIRSNTQDQGYDAADKKGQIFSRSLTSVSNATILPIDGEASFMLVFYAEKNDKVGEIPYVVATVRDAFQLQHAGERSEARGI